MRSIVHSYEFNTMEEVIRVFVADLLLQRKKLFNSIRKAFATNAQMNKINCAFL